MRGRWRSRRSRKGDQRGEGEVKKMELEDDVKEEEKKKELEKRRRRRWRKGGQGGDRGGS